MSKSKIAALLAVLFLVFSTAHIARAEDETPQYPIYIVQDGDTLGQIAVKFNVTVDELILVNNLADANNISAGSELKIPGLSGFVGTLTTVSIAPGDTLQSLAQHYQMPVETLAKLNHVTSPDELYSGARLILIESDNQPTIAPQAVLGSQQPVLEMALLNHANPWEMILQNQETTAWDTLSGTIFYSRIDSTDESIYLTPSLISISLTPEVLVQGKSAIVRVETTGPAEISGMIGEHRLNFYEESSGVYVAYQGIHAQEETGLLNLTLISQVENMPTYHLDQMVLVKPGGYASEELIVDPATIDAEVNDQENNQILQIVSNPSDEKRWTVPLSCPVEPPSCIKSWFGTRRSYNDGLYTSFHGGLDFGVCSNLNALATAPGTVIFTGNLVVRGNAILIDHGWGIVTGYYHLDSINVSVGDQVETGQLIGIIGATGRVTGAHLHYEVWVNGVQVDPQDWLDSTCQ